MKNKCIKNATQFDSQAGSTAWKHHQLMLPERFCELCKVRGVCPGEAGESPILRGAASEAQLRIQGPEAAAFWRLPG